ncbi:glycosyltransferase family 4 protein [Pokkaliibacter sp. CJK22405]|uniref:glycosyltransferase family 4 protein n=1 Tax=Pokkaliibacter sp. CJK22405 TaxID=3384615 RepID=UPI003984F923
MIQHILIITDAWTPQTNGVVTTLRALEKELQRTGMQVTIVHPGLFRTVPCPSYPEVRLACCLPHHIGNVLHQWQPDAVHIATEGPLGITARHYLNRHQLPYTTSLHTKFPEYVNTRWPWISLAAGYRFLNWFHRESRQVLVTTPQHRHELVQAGMNPSQLTPWGRGVDLETFYYLPEEKNLTEPTWLYVGRIAVEKNIEAFLKLNLPGRKRVVGDGPARAELQRRYPKAEWLGVKRGEALRQEYARANALVFPSRTDTFGLVMLEALACGTPVAAYPVTGPRDIIEANSSGILSEDLQAAALKCLTLDSQQCRQAASQHSWGSCAERFIGSLVRLRETLNRNETSRSDCNAA